MRRLGVLDPEELRVSRRRDLTDDRRDQQLVPWLSATTSVQRRIRRKQSPTQDPARGADIVKDCDLNPTWYSETADTTWVAEVPRRHQIQ